MLDDIITFEEYKQLVKEGFIKNTKILSAKVVDKYINSDEAMECIKGQYNRDKIAFEKGEITEEQVRVGGVTAVAYALYMLY